MPLNEEVAPRRSSHWIFVHLFINSGQIFINVPKSKVILFLAGSTLFIVFFFYTYQILYTPNILVDKEGQILIIDSNATFLNIQKDLVKGKFVDDIISFSFLARLRKYDRHIHAGRYYLRSNMTNLEALRLLQSGTQTPVNITFTHARLLSDLGPQITKNIGISTADFYAALKIFLDTHKSEYNQNNILSLFIPNTYEVYYNISSKELINRIYREYNRFWSKKRRDKAQRIELSPIEVSILASIVQAEIAKKDEAPIVAGLYLNRLKANMPLQADPTLIYALGDFSLKRVLNKHKKIDSPYNTYIHRGLPPGPINMPKIVVIDAVLNATDHNYIYMCAKEDFSGYHNFSSTLRQHLVYARKYQRTLTMKQRKAKALSQKK